MTEATGTDHRDPADGAGRDEDGRDEDGVEALSEDVARLLQAVRDVAADQHRWGEAFRAVVAGHGDGDGGGTADRPDGAADGGAAGESPSRSSSGSSGSAGTCRACPVCQGLTVLRETRPEAYDHLARAVTAAGEALRVLLAPSRPQGSTHYSPGPRPGAATDRESTPAGPAGTPERARPEPVAAERIEIDEGAQ